MEDTVIKNITNKSDDIVQNLPKKKDDSIEHLRKVLRPIKYSLVDLFISIARVLFFWLPGDIERGKGLLILHFIGGSILYTIYFMLPKKNPYKLLIFLFFVFLIVQQLVFRGCVITKAEQYLTKNTNTVVDPWIRLGGFEPTKELRVVTSISFACCMALTLLMNTILDQFI